MKLHGVTDAQVTNGIDHVFEEFEDIMDGSVGCYVGGAVKIEIEEGGKPVACKPYRVPEALKEKVKDAV